MAHPLRKVAVPTRVRSTLRRSYTPTERIGAPGFASYSGFLQEREKDGELSGTQKYTTYSNILANTSIVAAGVRFFLNLIAKSSWKVEPANESAEAKRIAELIEDIMHDMRTPWHRVVRRAALYKFYGFGLQEWTAKRRDDGVIGYFDVEPRAQQTVEQWDTNEFGDVLGVVQRSPQDGTDIYIPREKLVYMVDDSINDTPEGLGMFRHLVKSARKLERLEQLEGWGYETDLRGIPIGRVPLQQLEEMVNAGRVTKEQAAALINPVETFVKNHIKSPTLGLMLDSATARGTGTTQAPTAYKLYDIEIIRGEDGPHKEVAQAIERLNREMARILGVEHLLLGSTSAGSFALSQDKTRSFGMIVDSANLEICQNCGRDYVEPLMRLNGWPKELKPKLRTEQIKHQDIESITSALKDMADAGAPLQPEDEAINEIRELLGLSAAKPGPAPQPQPQPEPDQPPDQPPGQE